MVYLQGRGQVKKLTDFLVHGNIMKVPTNERSDHAGNAPGRGRTAVGSNALRDSRGHCHQKSGSSFEKKQKPEGEAGDCPMASY